MSHRWNKNFTRQKLNSFGNNLGPNYCLWSNSSHITINVCRSAVQSAHRKFISNAFDAQRLISVLYSDCTDVAISTECSRFSICFQWNPSWRTRPELSIGRMWSSNLLLKWHHYSSKALRRSRMFALLLFSCLIISLPPYKIFSNFWIIYDVSATVLEHQRPILVVLASAPNVGKTHKKKSEVELAIGKISKGLHALSLDKCDFSLLSLHSWANRILFSNPAIWGSS